MLTKKLWRRGLSLAAAVALTGSLAVGPAFAQEERYQQPTLNPHVKSIMEVDGYQFIDLNSNGELDVYEDWRQDADTRAADLVSQMTVREKIPPSCPGRTEKSPPICRSGAMRKALACC